MTITDLIRECEKIINEYGMLLDKPNTEKLIACLKLQTEALNKISKASTDYFEDEMVQQVIWCRGLAQDALTASEKIASGEV